MQRTHKSVDSQVRCSFDFLQFTDPEDPRDDVFEGTLLWELTVIPAPGVASVRPKSVPESEIDQVLPPVNLETPASCNCFVFGSERKCLGQFDTYREPTDPLTNLLITDSEEENDSEERVSDRDSDADGTSDHEDVDIVHAHYFPIVGSNWEERYQTGLSKCYELQVQKSDVRVRAQFQPDNVRDRNAIKFEVLHNEQCFILGYCGVKKIPKLTWAMHSNSIIYLKLCNLRRHWIPPISDFRFGAGVSIVKSGREWERDDPNNRYNSAIAPRTQ